MLKILSWNIRGLGSTIKRKAIRRIISEKRISVICIQETKLEVIDQRCVNQIWGGSNNVGVEWAKASGMARGLCIWWDLDEFEKSNVIIGDRIIIGDR
ncbi:hypothetical protein L1049_001315 [Liquidambar formosana]|uniref:Endonuclease/exonuclease/phosphatase domain-containing protein n=1 Tax=Liquidambar formosana TaxID=63359 RepID=A0AAP0NEG4_LIQFO